MSTSNRLDDLVAGLQSVRDEDLASESRSPSAEALFDRIVADLDGATWSSKSPHDPRRRGRRWSAAAAATAPV
jgi:hypothetical protein